MAASQYPPVQVGVAGEGAPIARAMVSAYMTLVYIAEDRDSRTAAYFETDRLERKKRILTGTRLC